MSEEQNEIQENASEQETPAYVVERLDEQGTVGVFEVSVADDDEGINTNQEQEANNENSEQENQENAEQENNESANEENSQDNNESSSQESQEQQQEIAQPQLIDKESVLSYLKENGIEVSDIEDLKPKEVKKFDPLVEKLQEFIEKTGNTNLNDFFETQRDWSKEAESTRLMAYLRIENPDLTQQQLDFLFKRKYSYDAEYDDEEVVMDKQISQKQDLRKADSLLEQRKQEFMVKRGSEDLIPDEYKTAKSEYDRIANEQKNYQDALKRQQESFVAETTKLFTTEFEGFKVSVDGKEYKIRPQDVNATKAKQVDVGNIVNKYFDKETGNITDTAGYHRALFFADNPDLAAKHFIEIGRAEEAERAERESKNITPGMKTIPSNGKKPKYFVERAD